MENECPAAMMSINQDSLCKITETQCKRSNCVFEYWMESNNYVSKGFLENLIKEFNERTSEDKRWTRNKIRDILKDSILFAIVRKI
jgi:hypothetical protein